MDNYKQGASGAVIPIMPTRTVATVIVCSVVALKNSFVQADGAPCKDNFACSLNGLCTQAVCVCDPGWTSHPELGQGEPDCGMLDLKPSKSYESFHGISEQSSSWGGSVLQLPINGTMKFAMFAAEMTHNCTLRHWTTNSEVVLALADDPTGPYVEQFQIIPPWAHNPEAIHTTDDMVVIFTLGDGIPLHGPEYRCDRPPAPSPAPPKPPTPPVPSGNVQTVNFTLHYAPVANAAFASQENWRPYNASIVDFPVEFQFPGNWNPAPVQLPDGRVRIMVHTGWSGMANGE